MIFFGSFLTHIIMAQKEPLKLKGREKKYKGRTQKNNENIGYFW